MVYPHGRSSVRFEKLIEGIQAHEKARLLRAEYVAVGDIDKLARLDALLQQFGLNSQYTEDYPALIREGQQVLNNLTNH
jgi:hypothetical protein